ncbi:alpha-1,3-galactosidase-related protein, partial [Bacteroides caccae]
TFLGEVVSINSKEGWREIKPFQDGFCWKVEKGQIRFPNIDGFNYTCLGSTLPFEKRTKRVVHGAIDIDSNPSGVERMKNGNLRIYEKLNYYPPVGALLSSKGDREHDRYAPAFDFKECKNICLDSITIHHALGMGFLFERSENMQILNSQIVLPKHTQRVISTTADATHFVNCKGDILIENCRFENMLDDGTNVHGTCVEVDEVIDDYTVRVSLKHFEQLGFKFAERGDDIWFIIHPSPQRGEVNTVSRVFTLNERFIQLSFAKPLPAGLKRGDILENNTWNPTFTMRGCTIRNHRARSVILKTPLKTIIENNQYSGIKPFSLLKADTVSQKTLSFDKMCFTK